MWWRCGPLLLLAVVSTMGAGCPRPPLFEPRDAASVDAAVQAPSTLPTAPSPPALTLFYGGSARGQDRPSDQKLGLPVDLARRANLADRMRARGGPFAQVEVGTLLDTARSPEGIAPSAPQEGERFERVLRAYARIGIDVVTFGERDLAVAAGRRAEKKKPAKVDVVLTNVRTMQAGKGQAARIHGDSTLVIGGNTIGILGIVEASPAGQKTLARLGYRVDDATAAARTGAARLRKRGAALVVGLFHLPGGFTRAREILAHAPGIDVVVLAPPDKLERSSDLHEGELRSIGATAVVSKPATGDVIGALEVRELGAPNGPRFENHLLALSAESPDHFGVALIDRAAAAAVSLDVVRTGPPSDRQRNGALAAPPPQAAESWTYGSNGACEMCHKAAADQWRTTDHARALATLLTVRHEREPECLGCHATGYLQPGGTQHLDTALKFFANVGCESCHGPSAAHVRSLDKKQGTSRAVKAEVCRGCHTPDWNIGPFEMEIAIKAILGPGHGAPPPPPPPSDAGRGG